MEEVVMKTILLENDGLLTQATKDWVTTIDVNYIEINPSTRNYMRRDDLYFFTMLIDPELSSIATSSSFQSIMDYTAQKSFGKTRKDTEEKFYQLEYFAWLIYEAVGYRKKHNLMSLMIHINYRGVDFLRDVNEERLGEDVKTYLKLMMRQSEGHVILNLYQDYVLYEQIQTEDELEFTR